jgi:hypothetical protein
MVFRGLLSKTDGHGLVADRMNYSGVPLQWDDSRRLHSSSLSDSPGGRMSEEIVLADDGDLFKRAEMVAQNQVILYQCQSTRRGGPIAT